MSALALWLIHLGIHLSHGGACYPQIEGKDERFHLTLVWEVLRHCPFLSLHVSANSIAFVIATIRPARIRISMSAHTCYPCLRPYTEDKNEDRKYLCPTVLCT